MKSIIYSVLFAFAMCFTSVSCSDNKTIITPQEEKDISSISFNFSFEDYGEEQDETRGNMVKTSSDTTVNIGGIEADFSVDNDEAPSSATTRSTPMEDGNYTIRAYQNGILKGEIKGTLTSGKFAPSGITGIQLSHGTYRFICFNDKVTPSGNNLIVTQANAATALIGQNVVAINQEPRQMVTFQMKHVGARIRLKIVGLMHFPELAATMSGLSNTSTPAQTTINGNGAMTNTNGTVNTANFTFTGSTELPFSSESYNTQSAANQYYYVLPNTDAATLALKFTKGAIYNQNMNTESAKPFSRSRMLSGNGSYLLKITLRPRYVYLFQDGTTGYLKDRGTRRPIGVVVSNGLAIALKDVTNSTSTNFYTGDGNEKIAWNVNTTQQVNVNMYSTNFAAAYNNNDGYQETFDGTYSIDGSPKSANPANRAFYATIGYRPGITTTGANLSSWFLPSYGQWHKAFDTLGFMNHSTPINGFGQNANSYNKLMNSAFTAAGGNAMSFAEPYWSASEYDTWRTCAIHATSDYTHFGLRPKFDPIRLRSFINF